MSGQRPSTHRKPQSAVLALFAIAGVWRGNGRPAIDQYRRGPAQRRAAALLIDLESTRGLEPQTFHYKKLGHA